MQQRIYCSTTPVGSCNKDDSTKNLLHKKYTFMLTLQSSVERCFGKEAIQRSLIIYDQAVTKCNTLKEACANNMKFTTCISGGKSVVVLTKPNNCNADMWPLDARRVRRDRRGRDRIHLSAPVHAEDRQIVRMAVTGSLSHTSRTTAQHIVCVCNASFSVSAYHSTPFTAERSVRKTSVAWSTLDAEPQTSPPPMVR
ncbi:hypothetical protein TNCV_1618311 [Trichonephila clavipes]|nr:hypothetical protein TNCV_1618311 [Trichonephila clavipes]